MNCRILYVVGQLDRGGQERQLVYLLRAMDREVYRPGVVIWTRHEDEAYLPALQDLDVPVYSLPQGAGAAAKLLAFRALVRRLRPEVIHSYSFFTNVAAQWAASGTATIPIGSIRSDFQWARTEAGPILGRLSARWPRNQICNSAAALQAVRSRRFVCAPKRLGLVPNAADLTAFRDEPVATGGVAEILGIGYLLPVKRWERLLRAVREVRDRGLRCRVRIAGDGPLESELREQARALGVDRLVEFIGHSADVPGLIAQSTFVVHTAEAEGSPNAVLEAMAGGRAVVATDAGDAAALVEHGVTGFVVPPNDMASLVAHVSILIADRSLCQSMGRAARQRAERQFGITSLAEGTLDFYRRAGWRDAPCASTRLERTRHEGAGCDEHVPDAAHACVRDLR